MWPFISYTLTTLASGIAIGGWTTACVLIRKGKKATDEAWHDGYHLGTTAGYGHALTAIRSHKAGLVEGDFWYKWEGVNYGEADYSMPTPGDLQ